ncbi:MAG: family 10 glycosylhydrolase [Bacteroidetes bacterium]|nr:family 10 glycosylhydrolase [Bacteroidota bacterium]
MVTNRQRCCLLFTLLVLFAQTLTAQTPWSQGEVRGVWLTNVDSKVLESRASIAEAMQFLKEHHFNVVFPVVWNDAKTLYRSRVMDSVFGMPIDPRQIRTDKRRDPLREVIEEAHARGIAVVPWFEYGFSSSFNKKGGMVLKKFPHWSARDGQGNLLKKNGFEWMNPYHPEVQEFILSLVREVVSRYDVDGVQGDDRLPANPSEGGYDPYTRSLYALEHHGTQPPNDPKDPSWLRWRGDRLNAFGKRLYDEVKRLKPNVLVTWSPSIFSWSFEEYLQDWPAWINGGYADLVIPQVYRYSIDRYTQALTSQSNDSLAIPGSYRAIVPGILMNVGTYLIEEEHLLQAMQVNRDRGYRGEVFFFYEGLRKNDGRLAKAIMERFYQEAVGLPWK